jgi:hypothetical protein
MPVVTNSRRGPQNGDAQRMAGDTSGKEMVSPAGVRVKTSQAMMTIARDRIRKYFPWNRWSHSNQSCPSIAIRENERTTAGPPLRRWLDLAQTVLIASSSLQSSIARSQRLKSCNFFIRSLHAISKIDHFPSRCRRNHSKS